MIHEETAFHAWQKALQHIIDHGHRYKDVRGRVCIEVSNLHISVKDPTKQLTLPIEHLQNIQEWVYPSLTEIAEIILAKQQGYTYGYAYGARLFSYGGTLNQINDYIIPLLKQDPTSRRAIVSLYDPHKDAQPGAENVPGMVVLDFKIRDGRLQIIAFIRSNDMFIGWPANIYQLFVLQEYVSARLDVAAGSLTTFSTSAHLFEDHINRIKQLL
jgi:thymidylate synthase